MNEISRNFIGYFESDDSIIAGDPTGEGLVFKAKPGIWNVFKTEDNTYTQELLIRHTDLKDTQENKLSWIAEETNLLVISDQCGFYDLESFLTQKTKDDVTGNPLNHLVSKFGCLVISGYGKGYYNLFLSYNRIGEVIAAKINFIDEPQEDDVFESYSEEDLYDTHYSDIWVEEDLDFGE